MMEDKKRTQLEEANFLFEKLVNSPDHEVIDVKLDARWIQQIGESGWLESMLTGTKVITITVLRKDFKFDTKALIKK